jgi:hypothetical protein
MLLITAPGWAVIRGLNRQTTSQSRANGGGHNCVPNKDRADFPFVWESDHTIAIVQGALRPMLGAIADCLQKRKPRLGEAGLSNGEAEGGDRTLQRVSRRPPIKVQRIEWRGLWSARLSHQDLLLFTPAGFPEME